MWYGILSHVVQEFQIVVLRLGESVSQVGPNVEMAKYARQATHYIEELERKIWYLEQLQNKQDESPEIKQLAVEIENLVAMPERSPEAIAALPSGSTSHEDSGYWDEEMQQEWDDWQAEKWEDYAGCESSWEEDAQPPSDELRRAAKFQSFEALPALPANAPPTSSAPAAPDANRVNSVTHRAQYMRLATWYCLCVRLLQNSTHRVKHISNIWLAA